MCKQNQQQQTSTQAQSAKEERTPLDVEIRKAELEVQLATLRQNAAYNASVAGQMQRQFETYQRIAVPLAESDFVPSAYKGKVGNCVIAVEWLLASMCFLSLSCRIFVLSTVHPHGRRNFL